MDLKEVLVQSGNYNILLQKFRKNKKWQENKWDKDRNKCLYEGGLQKKRRYVINFSMEEG